MVAFLITFVLLLMPAAAPRHLRLWAWRAAPVASAVALRWLSAGEHFQELLKGLVDTSDLTYFVVMIGSFLLLTKASVESVRWRWR